jgi:hypothetical protein
MKRRWCEGMGVVYEVNKSAKNWFGIKAVKKCGGSDLEIHAVSVKNDISEKNKKDGVE